MLKLVNFSTLINVMQNNMLRSFVFETVSKRLKAMGKIQKYDQWVPNDFAQFIMHTFQEGYKCVSNDGHIFQIDIFITFLVIAILQAYTS